MRLPVGCALLVLTTAACGRDAVDFEVKGLGVHVETDAQFAHQPAFPSRLEEVLDASLRYWGGHWSELAGRTLTLSSGPYVACAGVPGALGCYDGNLRVSTWDPGVGTVRCVEQTVLVHEIGHAIIHDPRHLDPRWMDLTAVAEALAGGVGYGAGGEGPCDIAVSVWRHPAE
jgi:hypothetical protein